MNETIAGLAATMNRHDAEGMAARMAPGVSSRPIPTAVSAVPRRWPSTGANCSPRCPT
jgi:hypothetical protein